MEPTVEIIKPYCFSFLYIFSLLTISCSTSVFLLPALRSKNISLPSFFWGWGGGVGGEEGDHNTPNIW